MSREMKKERKNCPFCGESISADAMKCRFCGEWLDENELEREIETKQSRKFRFSYVQYFAIWVVTLLTFLGILFAFRSLGDQPPPFLLYLFLGDVLIGGFAFLRLLKSLISAMADSSQRGRKVFVFSLVTVITFLLFFAFLLYFPWNENKTPSSPQAIVNCPEGEMLCFLDGGKTKECLRRPVCIAKVREQLGTPPPSPLSVASPTTQTAEKKTVSSPGNSDPPVHCTIDPACGGGTTPLKKSECERARCCQVNGKYTFTKDPNQCEDTIVNCTIHPNCGGGIREMTKKACSEMTCCEVNGTWVLRSKGTCNDEQERELYSSWSDFCAALWLGTGLGNSTTGYYECLAGYDD